MIAAPVSSGQGGQGRSWWLLIHQLPPEPSYLRVKIRRRLQQLGAAPIKATVYALPATEEALEDFHWLATEIEGLGGSAMVCRAEFLRGISDEEIDGMLEGTDGRLAEEVVAPDRVLPGRTWVTRQGIKVDRIASAWLIRRWIDPEAKFRFVQSMGYQPAEGDLRFDMFEAEYTHTGDWCTFQTLVHRFGLTDPALLAIGEIVHDIDCKDARFGRPDTAGVEVLIRGVVASTPSDDARLARGGVIFDSLYAALGTAPA